MITELDLRSYSLALQLSVPTPHTSLKVIDVFVAVIYEYLCQFVAHRASVTDKDYAVFLTEFGEYPSVCAVVRDVYRAGYVAVIK